MQLLLMVQHMWAHPWLLTCAAEIADIVDSDGPCSVSS